MKEYTKSKVFTNTKAKTEVFTRFSRVVGSKGCADTVRDIRGFAVKFYTEDGNYDLVGNNFPVFFIRDALKFPDVIHSLKPSPDDNLYDPARFWDFISHTPEATNVITMLYSDFGTIKSFRTMKGSGVNTYVWVNELGKRYYVKYHWVPLAGESCISRQEAEILAGLDPDIAVKDLYSTLSQGKEVEYELYVQLIDVNCENNYNFDPLDATKIWPKKDFPWKLVGKMVLTHGPENFFTEVEQSAFAPANLVPGIEASADKLLQGRLFAYKDTARHRIGPNFDQLPINKPKVQVNNNQRDGDMNLRLNKGKVNYSPNSLDQDRPYIAKVEGKETSPYVEGYITQKVIAKTDDFSQAGELYRSYSKEEKEHLIGNIIAELWSVDESIQKRLIKHFKAADIDYGTRIEHGLKLNKSK